jgi:hypothetical protein
MKALLVGVSLAALVAGAHAQAPRLNSVSPPGAQRGGEVELKLYGARLDKSPELIFDEGISAKIESAKTNQIKAALKIAKDTRLGEHQLRIRTASGVSELRTFWISAYTNIAEFETNGTMKQAHRVPLGVTINGTSGGEDVDFFRVDAKKSQRVSAEVEAIRLGRAMLDPYLAIRDADGKILAQADDTTLLAQDAYVSILAPKDGAYYIEMRDGTYSGNGLMDYRLHIGAFPRPAMIFPLGGKAGDEVEFKFIGDAGGEFSQKVKLPAEPNEKFGVFAEQNGQIAPSPNWVRVSPFANVNEMEPNDTRETASGYAEAPIAFNGVIAKKGDLDWFRFSAKKGQALDVNVYARRLRSPIDTTIQITDAKGNSLASNDDGAGADSVAKFTAPADGNYFISVRDQFGNGGPDFGYRIEVTPQMPTVAMSIPEVARNDSQSRQFIMVPRGNRFATMMLAKRANFAGDLNFNIADLPHGVKMSSETLLGKLDQEPIVFEATSDAPIGGKYVNFVAKPTDTGKSVESHFHHSVEFIAGPNNTYYYSTIEPKLYVAVCEEAPFKLRIEEPKAPLVQYGALDLKVVADRKPGFDKAINVKMMWNPPGVGSLPDITIPKGSNSAIYSLNAKADAQPHKWKVAVIGSSGTESRGDRGSAIYVSSSLTTLEVAEPFVVGTMSPVIVSPGQEAKLVCKLDQKKPFEGKAHVHVLGLPEGIEASEAEITSADKEVTIKLKVGSKVAHASYRNFLCAADVIHNGQKIAHNLASGAVIRVVPPKKGGAPRQVASK